MHILSGGRLRMRKSVYLPDADRAETIELPVSCVHPGCGGDGALRARRRALAGLRKGVDAYE
jgi:hypothetical protein